MFCFLDEKEKALCIRYSACFGQDAAEIQDTYVCTSYGCTHIILASFSAESLYTLHLEYWQKRRVAYGNRGEMFLRPRGAMQDGEDQGVSNRKVSGTETIFLIVQRPNSKRHGLTCTSLRRTSKKEGTATTRLERGESSRGSLTAVGLTQRRPLPPPPSQRRSGGAVRHVHKQHLLSFPPFLCFIGR